MSIVMGNHQAYSARLDRQNPIIMKIAKGDYGGRGR